MRAVSVVPLLAVVVPPFDGPDAEPLPWLLLGAVALGIWFVLFTLVAAVTMPRSPSPGPATAERGPEPPAIANLLTHRWKVTTAAASATLVDLAARGWLDLDRYGDGTMLLRLRRTRAPQEALAPYEESVLHLVRSRAVDDVLPAPALLEGSSASWFDGFRAEVEQAAIGAGLARPRWSKGLGALLWATLSVALLPIGLALDIWEPNGPPAPQREWGGVLAMAGAAALGVVALGRRRLRGLRHTPAGQDAAAHWLGVQRFYDEQRSFLDVGADGVVVWDRHLADACALGEAPIVAATFPLAPQPENEAWSPATGLWREIEVAFPRRPVEPMTPGRTALVAGFHTLVAAGGLGAAGWFVVRVADPVDLVRADRSTVELALAAGLAIVLAVPSLICLARLRRWAPVLFAALGDGSSRVVTEGVVVKHASRVLHAGNERRQVDVHYTAVDTGRAAPGEDAAVVVFPAHLPAGLYRWVRVEHSPRLRHVYAAAPVDAPSRWHRPTAPPPAAPPPGG